MICPHPERSTLVSCGHPAASASTEASVISLSMSPYAYLPILYLKRSLAPVEVHAHQLRASRGERSDGGVGDLRAPSEVHARQLRASRGERSDRGVGKLRAISMVMRANASAVYNGDLPNAMIPRGERRLFPVLCLRSHGNFDPAVTVNVDMVVATLRIALDATYNAASKAVAYVYHEVPENYSFPESVGPSS